MSTRRTTVGVDGRRRRIHAHGAAVAAIAALAAATLPMGTAGASSVLTEESFRNPTAASSVWVAGGTGGPQTGWPDSACLTAGADTAATPLPGCGLTTPDAAGSGVLRLTSADNSLSGFALRNESLPSSYGLDITFNMAQWGGNGADGIAFFIVDGAVELTQPGSLGGGLGYVPSDYYGVPGVNGALMGIGFDAYGNFSQPDSDGDGCPSVPGVGSQRVVLRGPGQGFSGYCQLAASGPLARPLDDSTRAAATRVVRVVIDPDSEEGQFVRVYLDGAEVLVAPVPVEFTRASAFKFGFAAATGGQTNNHEVWGMEVESVLPVPPTPDPDTDGDGIPNPIDVDLDGDGLPNVTDPDVDGDGIPNVTDPDIDGDGIPNAEDPDADGDGIPNAEDPDADGAEETVAATPRFTG